MTSIFFQQYIAGYTVAKFGHPIRRRVTKSSAFEWPVIYVTLLTLNSNTQSKPSSGLRTTKTQANLCINTV